MFLHLNVMVAVDLLVRNHNDLIEGICHFTQGFMRSDCASFCHIMIYLVSEEDRDYLLR